MEGDDLELDKIGDRKTALFCIVSDTDMTFNFISAMVYTQMFNVLCDRALQNGGALPIHVTCLLDEFANQKIPNFQHLISVIRSREISAHIVVQTQSQLKAVYKDHAETIIGNCSCVLFLGGKERSTLKELSETLGKETIDLYNTSDTRGSQRSMGVNYQKLGKEMILTFMMSQAQAESESLSGNVKWGHRKNFKDGKVYYHYASFLGYRKGPDGLPEIDPDEAPIVRRIFSRYLLGQSVRQICRDLMADGVKTAQGSDSWHDSVVRKMLQNEKYIGDALLQKTYMADLFTHEQRKNMGELPQYYVHECHPAIIDRDTFQRVQEELARRSSLRKTSSKTKTELGKYCGKYVLSELLVCGECGSPYRRVVWSRPEGKRIVWRCINRLEHGKKVCKKSPTWNEADIHAAVTAAMNELFHAQTAREALEASITAALAGEDGELSLPALEAQIKALQERQIELFQLAVSAGPDCLDYDEEIQRVNTAKTSLMAQRAELEREGRTAAAFDRRMEEITRELEQTAGTITEFDEITVRQLVSNIKVVSKDTLLVCFKDGTEITQTVENTGMASA